MQAHDGLWLLSLSVGIVNLSLGALNTWQNLKIENAVLRLRGELAERIAKMEGQVQAQQAGNVGSHSRR